MARRRAFLLRIEINIHTVHYQEAKLCQSGNVILSVNTLNSTAVTMPAYPSFPIHFHEKLIFEKVIDCVATLAEIQDHLNKEWLKAELLQRPRHYSGKPMVISQFRTKLGSLLFPKCLNKAGGDEGNIRLLMEPTQMLSGKTGPKVEVSTKTIVEEMTECRAVAKNEAHHRELACCRHNIKSCIFACGCHSADHFKHRAKKRHKRFENGHLHCHETMSCDDCCICSYYTGYFDPKPYIGHRSRSCSCMKSCEGGPRFRHSHVHVPSATSLTSSDNSAKLTSEDQEKMIPPRQLFYDKLSSFYERLRDKSKCSHL